VLAADVRPHRFGTPHVQAARSSPWFEKHGGSAQQTATASLMNEARPFACRAGPRSVSAPAWAMGRGAA